MTEPLCENRFTLTKSLFYEATRLVYRDKNGKLLRWLFISLGVLWAALALFALRQGGGLVSALIELFVLAFAWLWASVLIPNGKARRAWAQLCDTERTVRFYGDRLVVDTGERSLTVPYPAIVKTLRSKNLVIFITDEHNGIITARGAFTIGTEETALKLIKNEKGA